MKQHAKCLGQRLFHSNVTVWAHTDTHTPNRLLYLDH